MPNDPTDKKALHKRSVNVILKISDTESSTSNNSLETMIPSSLKAASPASLKDLQKMPKLSLLPVAETVDKIPKLSLLPVAESVETIPLPSLLPVAEIAEEDSEFPPPSAAASGSQIGEDSSPNRSEPMSLNVHRSGPLPGPSRGGTRGHSSSSRSSTLAAAYSTIAATMRNFLIHVYWSQDDLEPFPGVGELYTLRDKIKTSIWSFFIENGADRDLSVKDLAFHREKRIGLIFCTSEARQKRVIWHIIKMGLGGHIIETFHDLSGGMKMSFKMPLCFESQHLARLMEAIFVINDLTGDCGSRELKTDRLRSGSPYVVCTIHFPDIAVEYAEQQVWRLQGPDGMLFLYGTDVTLRPKANFEKEKKRKIKEEIWRQENPTPPPLKHPQIIVPPRPASQELKAVLAASIAAAKSCTIATELVPAAGFDGEAMLLAPYPHVMRKEMDLTKDYA
jgi:hypothetical protein